MNIPTWEDVIRILRSDRLRNYTVDVETTATAFDNQEQQQEAIDKLTQTYIGMAQLAEQLSPELIKGFIPIIRMNLSTCKLSSSISRQLEEALDAAYRSVEEESKQPPQPTPEQQKLQADMQLQSAKLESEKQRALLDNQVEMKRLAIEHDKVMGEARYKEAEIAIKKQEADRKEAELQAQIYLEQEKIESDVGANVNIAGDIKDLI